MLNPGDIVIVKFPYAESKGYKWRPALVVSSVAFHKRYGMCWVVMITSTKNAPLHGDISLSSLKDTGLDTPCIIRPAKLATLQVDKAEKIGNAATRYRKEALKFIRQHLG
jgi:mRNA interferase MazF